MIGKNNLLFRVSHRFIRTVDSGYDTYYGLNGPAVILVGFGYGILDNLGVTIGHSNFNHEWELGANWLALQQGQISLLPISVAIHASGSLITTPEPCHSVWRSENFKFNVQASLAYQVSDAIALLLAPSFSTNTNYLDPLSENTFALGTGGRFMFMDNISIVGEWLPILSGYKNKHNGWGLGLEYKTGGHVFHVFVANSYGLTSDQYITGGELNFKDNDYRFGFNIYRTFWF